MLDLSERSQCFYWQTDRNLTAAEYELYFLKRHEVTVADINSTLKEGITSLSLIKEISVLDPDENVLKGNVNIVRKVRIDGNVYVVRLHPRGVKNGYFAVEAAALKKAAEKGLPVPDVLEIHEATTEKDMDFVLMTASSGITMELAIQQHPETEDDLLNQAGKLLAAVHEIEVEGFGFFNNKIAKQEQKLVGLHDSYRQFVACGLEENIDRLVSFNTIDTETADLFRHTFSSLSYEPIHGPRLVHNDYADWNILVNDGQISAVLDWDECHAGDPIADLACWSTFFTMDRYAQFLNGYTSVTTLPDDYEQRFHYYRLRYTISKMALRVKRSLVDDSQFIKDKIEVGKVALQEEVAWFKSV